jgi:glycosyltransferase involved in cell wall biosynthesis
MARVSIIIPTHNRAAMLRRAINSAMNAGKDVEVVVVDDASTDETQTTCQELDRITYIRLDRNVGQAQARNIGIKQSTGEFLAFLDDDDLRLPGSLDKQVDILSQSEELGFVYGQVQIGDPERCLPTGEVRPLSCPSGDLFWEFLKGNFVYIPSVLVRKRYFEAIGLFDPHTRGTEDWDAWIRLSETHPVAALEEPVAIYRDFTRSSGQTSSNRPQMCKSHAYTVFKALRSKRGLEAGPAVLRRVRSNCLDSLWDNLISEGRAALAESNYNYAIRNFVTAARLHPSRAINRRAIRVMRAIFSRAAWARG